MLTLGFGNERYRELAEGLASSLGRDSPGIRRAVVTVRPEELGQWYDITIPYEPRHEDGFAVRDVEKWTDLLRGRLFAARGRETRQGDWLGARIDEILDALGGLPLVVDDGGHSTSTCWRGTADRY